MKFLFVLICGLFAFNSQACFDEAELIPLFEDIQMETWSESEKSWVPLADQDLCQTNSLENKVVEALLDLKSWPVLDTVTLSGFELNTLKKTPFDFFRERVRTLRLNLNPESHQCDADISGTMAYVTDSSSHLMMVCPFAAKFTSFKMQGVLLHEARHLLQHEDFGNEKAEHVAAGNSPSQAHAHKPCQSGFFAGNFSCDPNFQATGAYGVEFEFYVRLAADPRVPRDIQLKARATAVETLLGHFNEIPQSKLGLLLQTLEGQLVFYNPDDQSLMGVLADTPSDAVLTDRFIPSFFDAQEGQAISYFGLDQFTPTRGTLAEGFRKSSAKEREGLIDVTFGLSHQCLLFTDRITCTAGDGPKTAALPEGFQPVALSIIRNMGQYDQLILMGQGGVHLRVPTELPIEEWAPENMTPIDYMENFVSVALLPKLQRYALTRQGNLVFYQSSKDKTPAPGSETYKYKKMIAPFRWSPIIEEIQTASDPL